MAERTDGKRLVIAFYETHAAGLVAGRALAAEGAERSVGLLELDVAGRPDVARLGGGGCGEGAGVDRLLGVIGSALLGGVMPKRSHLFDDGSELTIDDIARIGAELEAGHSAVAVLESPAAARRIVVRLAELGGRTEVHRLTERALRQAADMPPLAS